MLKTIIYSAISTFLHFRYQWANRNTHGQFRPLVEGTLRRQVRKRNRKERLSLCVSSKWKRFKRKINCCPGMTVVDLGAAPGGWSQYAPSRLLETTDKSLRVTCYQWIRLLALASYKAIFAKTLFLKRNGTYTTKHGWCRDVRYGT